MGKILRTVAAITLLFVSVFSFGQGANVHLTSWPLINQVGFPGSPGVVWDDLRVPAQNTRLNPVLSEPDFESWKDGLLAWHFDPANDSTNSLHFAAQLPHSYKMGTDLDPHIHWSPKTTNTGNVVWKFEYTIVDINGTFAASDTLSITDAADGTAFKHQLADFADISGTALTGVSAMLVGRVTRAGENAADTFTGDAVILEIDFHFQKDMNGSRQEAVK